MGKSLLESNVYLQDAEKGERALERTVVTSSAIEGIHVSRDAKTGRFTTRSVVNGRAKAARTSR